MSYFKYIHCTYFDKIEINEDMITFLQLNSIMFEQLEVRKQTSSPVEVDSKCIHVQRYERFISFHITDL